MVVCLAFGLTMLAITTLAAASPELEHARERYNRTDYNASLSLLNNLHDNSAEGFFLAGQNHFMLGDYKRSSEAFQMAASLEPSNSSYFLWLGRAYGRRAEMANPLSSVSFASKARQSFECSVKLDPANKEALDDLFDFYLQAPGIMGGGFDKAAAVARQIAAIDGAEGHYALSHLAERKKEYNSAEEHLRRAVALAPLKVGRVLELARFLAQQGRFQESDAVFDRAQSIAPDSPRVMFAKAKTLVQNKRNLDQARELLQRYIRSNRLTPDDPSRTEAEGLLRQVSGD
jgi:tetratricopeptide (TPR) repeat protein